MKWNIDRDMAPYEPASIPGTIWQRVLMQVSQARREGLRVPSTLRDIDVVSVWSLGIGQAQAPKVFVHGFTMYECFLRLRKMVKLKAFILPKQLFPKLGAKPRLKQRKRRNDTAKKGAYE